MNNNNNKIDWNNMTASELKRLAEEKAQEEQKKNPIGKFKNEDGKFDYFSASKWIIKKFNIVIIDEQLFIFDDGIYKSDIRLIKRKITERFPQILKNQMAEMIEKIWNIAEVETVAPPELIPVKNGYYNIENDTFHEHNPNVIFTQRFNVTYDPTAKFNLIDDVFLTLANNDKELVKMLIQIIAYMLYRKNYLEYTFLLVGRGGNGKSLYIRILEAIAGIENTSAVPLQDLKYRFSVSKLHNKLLNAGDDIPLNPVDDGANWKKLSTGENVLASHKHVDEFSFQNYAKLVFCANAIPRWDEHSTAVFDRLVIVPFNNRIRNTKQADKKMPSKVTTEQAKSYLFNLAIVELKEITKNDEMFMPNSVVNAMNKFQKGNNPIEQFLDYLTETYGGINHIRASESHKIYSQWCTEEEYKKPLGLTAFNNELEVMGYKRSLRNIDGFPTRQKVWTK